MRRTAPAAASLVAALSLAACAGQRVKAETAAAKVLVSDDDEERLGEQVKKELEAQGLKYLDDPQVTAYVQGIAKKILTLAEKDRPGVGWEVHVVDDPGTVNAFATPGGHLYVLSGLLLAADSEAEVAGVLAHEAGHVASRHSARQLVNAFGLQTVLSLALGENPNQLAAVAGAVAGKGVLLAHGREEELEADQYGVRYAAGSGYDPSGIVTFFEKLERQEGSSGGGGALKFLSTHPPTGDRIEKAKALIAKMGAKGGERGEARHAQVKKRLQEISPPPQKKR